MKAREYYLIFVVIVYESKDQLGNFTNSTKLELICQNRQEAEDRALSIAGDEVKKFAHTQMVIEKEYE